MKKSEIDAMNVVDLRNYIADNGGSYESSDLKPALLKNAKAIYDKLHPTKVEKETADAGKSIWIPADKASGSIQAKAFAETSFLGVIEVGTTKNGFHFAKCSKANGGYFNLPAANLLQALEGAGSKYENHYEIDETGKKRFILNQDFTAVGPSDWEIEIVQ